MRSSGSRSRSRSRSRSPDRARRDKRQSHSHRDHDRDRGRDRYSYQTRDHNRNRDSDSTRDRNRDRRTHDKDSSNNEKGSSSSHVLRSNSVLRAIVKPKISALAATINNHNHKDDDESTRPKPKFLSRKAREAIALHKLSEKRAQQQQKDAQQSEEREQFLRAARGSHARDRHPRHRDGDRESSDVDMRERASNHRNHHSHNHNNSKSTSRTQREQVRRGEQKAEELQLIKDQYLGKKTAKKSMVPPSQKFKFNFDWEASEDTSEDLNQLYAKRAKVAFLFGRGYIAGIDRDEQQKRNQSIYSELKQSHAQALAHASAAEQDPASLAIAQSLRERRETRERKKLEKYERDRLDARNWRDKKLSEMTERDWRILKEEFRISTKFGGRLPNPIRFWSESLLSEELLRAIVEVARYEEPYKIQRMAIPVGLQNRDCVGIAETGSGKTAAFLIPMLVYILKLPPIDSLNFEDGPYALVLAPTRELAKQIDSEAKKFASFTDIRAITIVGGVDQLEQSTLLREGSEIIIATPGRLLDCIDRRILVLNQCNYVVLDEADRMIDMGFEEQVKAIFDKMPSTNLRPIDDAECVDDRVYRQTFMFSATMPPAVERLTREYLRNPVYITIGDPNATANEHVKQNVLWIDEKSKRKKLQTMLANGVLEPPIMIFVNMKKNADTLAKYLRVQSFKATSLHGGKSQDLRELALAQFKKHEYDVLVCTNVAGRGIDIEGVKHVINYDMPTDIRDYCHRIGRTGRAGLLGVATSFLCKDDTEIMYELKKMLLKTGNSCPTELMQHEAAMRNPNAPFEAKTTKQILAKVKPV